MSMTLYMIPTTDERIETLRRQTQQEILAMLTGRYQPDLENSDPDIFDLYKAWDGIHFLLTSAAGDDQPELGYLMGGLPIGLTGRDRAEEDCYDPDSPFGYGPPRVLYRREVSAWADALEPLTTEALRARFDPEAFRKAELYAVRNDTPEEALDWLLDYYEPFREFIRRMAEAGNGLPLHMT